MVRWGAAAIALVCLLPFAADGAATRKRAPKPKPPASKPAEPAVVAPPAPESAPPAPVDATSSPTTEPAATSSPASTPAAAGTRAAPTAADAAPSPSSPPAATDKAVAPPAAQGDTKEEVITDFEEEERKLDQKLAPTMPPVNAPGGPPGRARQGGAGDTGFKLIVDLVLQHTLGQQSLTFSPNHTLAILMVNVSERVSLQLHIAPDPAFYELAFALTSSITLKVGKMLVPFGTNNFHHIIGGRVDRNSVFLPETWGDYGVGINHLLVDTRYLTLEYDAYVVNGFGGSTSPVVAAGTLNDNNFGKGLGGRLILGTIKGIRIIASAYHSLWNAANNLGALYYAVGGSIPVGTINLPLLNRIGLRGEWSRGELQYPEDNIQRGLTAHAIAKAGWYAELTVRLHDIAALRFRMGQVNPDNTVSNIDDVQLLEPAVVIGSPKLAFIAAWQMTKAPGRNYSPTQPADLIYAKVFLQY